MPGFVPSFSLQFVKKKKKKKKKSFATNKNCYVSVSVERTFVVFKMLYSLKYIMKNIYNEKYISCL